MSSLAGRGSEIVPHLQETFSKMLVRVWSLQGHPKKREFVFAAEMKVNPSEPSAV
jgi:hypothetical protein